MLDFNVACSSDQPQSVSYDMKYHLPCLVNAKRDIDQSKQPQSATVNCGQLLSDRQLADESFQWLAGQQE